MRDSHLNSAEYFHTELYPHISFKAKELANKTDLLFIRNSLTGAIQCKKNLNVNKLNEDLHDN